MPRKLKKKLEKPKQRVWTPRSRGPVIYEVDDEGNVLDEEENLVEHFPPMGQPEEVDEDDSKPAAKNKNSSPNPRPKKKKASRRVTTGNS